MQEEYKDSYLPGEYVSVKDTVEGFKQILEGKYDHIPESCFLNVGTIDGVVKKYEAMK